MVVTVWGGTPMEAIIFLPKMALAVFQPTSAPTTTMTTTSMMVIRMTSFLFISIPISQSPGGQPGDSNENSARAGLRRGALYCNPRPVAGEAHFRQRAIPVPPAPAQRGEQRRRVGQARRARLHQRHLRHRKLALRVQQLQVTGRADAVLGLRQL